MSLNYIFNLKTPSSPEEIAKMIKKKSNFLEYTQDSSICYLHNSAMTISCSYLDEEDKIIEFGRFEFKPDIELCINVKTENQKHSDSIIAITEIIVNIMELEKGDASLSFNYGDIAVFTRKFGKLHVNSQFCQSSFLIKKLIKLGGELMNIEIPELEDNESRI